MTLASVAPYSSQIRLIQVPELNGNWTRAAQAKTAVQWAHQQGQSHGQDVFCLNTGNNTRTADPRHPVLMGQLLKRIGVHALSLASHDFNATPEAWYNGKVTSNIPTLAVNASTQGAFETARQQNLLVTSAIRLMGNQGPVGVIGVADPALLEQVGRSIPLPGLQIADLQTTLQRIQTETNQLLQQGINRIILLSHFGPDLAVQLPHYLNGLDVILDTAGGRKAFQTTVTPANGEAVRVLCHERGQMDLADLTFDSWGRLTSATGQSIDLNTVTPDPEILATVQSSLGNSPVIGWLPQAYNNKGILTQSDPMANAVANVVQAVTQSDVAFVRASEIRESLPQGWVTERDLETAMPHNNPVVKLWVTGQELITLLQRSAAALKQGGIPPLHPSQNLHYTVSRMTGELTAATLNGQAIHPAGTYSVALSSFPVENPASYPELGHPDRILLNTGQSLRTLLQNQFYTSGQPLRTLPISSAQHFQVT